MYSLLIDLDKMKIIKVCEGKDYVRRLEYWADLLIPKSEFYIGGGIKRELSVFTLMELKMLHRNTSGEQLTNDDYKRAIASVHQLGENMDPDEDTLGTLVKRLKRPLAEQTAKPQKEKIISKKRPTPLAIRPRAGTVTAKVWEIADEMKAGDPGLGFESKDFRKCVIEECRKDSINLATAATQFAKWRSDQLTG